MSHSVIKVENVGKLYRLGEVGTGTISHDFNRWWAKVRGKEDPFAKIGETNDRTTRGNSDYVWSLKDVSFEVKQGDVLGIIGRNGAGKSTLLKLLSKVTTPTQGRIKIKGRIASLLEVGTGFHPELTGRENIYLNGAILGMTKAEINKKFDEIVDFSGVERYIDTPVKRYSSGMYVRLAFAVAAFLEPEILIVDEVLAVGDAEFQKKCLGRMKDVSVNDGRTVLFVSHNMAAVRALCNKGLLMINGKVDSFGDLQEIINNYEAKVFIAEDSFIDLSNYEKRTGNGYVKFEYIELVNKQKKSRKFFIGDDLIIRYTTKSYKKDLKNVVAAIRIFRSDGIQIANIVDKDSNFIQTIKETNNLEIILQDIRLYPGIYFLDFIIGTAGVEVYDFVEHCISFEVESDGRFTDRVLPQSTGIIFYTPIWREEQ